MGLLFDLFRDTPAHTLAADLAANRHAELVALSHELMGALRELQATLDRAERPQIDRASPSSLGWQEWPFAPDSCGGGNG